MEKLKECVILVRLKGSDNEEAEIDNMKVVGVNKAVILDCAEKVFLRLQPDFLAAFLGDGHFIDEGAKTRKMEM